MTLFRLVEIVDDYNSFTVARFNDGKNKIGIRVRPNGDKHSITFYMPGSRNGLYDDDEIPDQAHEAALSAIAYYRMTGSIEGFPDVELPL